MLQQLCNAVLSFSVVLALYFLMASCITSALPHYQLNCCQPQYPDCTICTAEVSNSAIARIHHIQGTRHAKNKQRLLRKRS